MSTPLTKGQLWSRYIDSNPHWITDGANLSPNGVRELFDQAFDRGHELGMANGYAAAERDQAKRNIVSMFDDMLGGRR